MSTDLDKLQGAWNVTSLEIDGQDMSTEALNGSQIVITKSRFRSEGMGTIYEGTVEVDDTTRPRTFDLFFTDGPEKGNRNRGIYKLDGDQWTICIATRDDKRPREFATQPGSGFALETLQRSPAKQKRTNRKSAPVLTSEGPITELEGEWAMVSAVFNGVAMAEDMVRWCTRITKGNLTTVLAGPQTMLKATFSLDRSRKPYGIDYVNVAGTAKGTTQKGIFEIDSETLSICMSPPDKPQPSDFSSKPGDGRTLTTWRRK